MSENLGQESDFFYVLEDAVRLLFADDDPILREFAMVNLASEQAKVTVAEDGVDALGRLREGEYDVVLLDLEMPRLDGFEVLARLRADEKTRDLPVIVVTGREDVIAIDRAFKLGATSFIVKPINWRLLSYQVRYVVRSAQAAARHREPELHGPGVMKLLNESRTFLSLLAERCPELQPETRRYAGALTAFVEGREP